MTPLRILIVDDEPEVRAVIGEYLSGLGHEVIHAASGREAIQAFDDGARISVAIVDWHMAGISGRDVVDYLHERHPRTRILVITGLTPDRVNENQIDAPIIALMRKPFKLRELAQRITRTRG